MFLIKILGLSWLTTTLSKTPANIFYINSRTKRGLKRRKMISLCCWASQARSFCQSLRLYEPHKWWGSPRNSRSMSFTALWWKYLKKRITYRSLQSLRRGTPRVTFLQINQTIHIKTTSHSEAAKSSMLVIIRRSKARKSYWSRNKSLQSSHLHLLIRKLNRAWRPLMKHRVFNRCYRRQYTLPLALESKSTNKKRRR